MGTDVLVLELAIDAGCCSVGDLLQGITKIP